jgi:hypothetical protein
VGKSGKLGKSRWEIEDRRWGSRNYVVKLKG